jgi:hypothetical protein
MPLPSLYIADGTQAWSVARAAAYGGAIGALAAMFKTLRPLDGSVSNAGGIVEIAGAALGFALLCGAAAALRNFIARRFVRQETE